MASPNAVGRWRRFPEERVEKMLKDSPQNLKKITCMAANEVSQLKVQKGKISSIIQSHVSTSK